ncbi:MAG: SpoIVB peptidase [Eubacterium sp.]|nr:SpoIVB peptidase [Eubacterium sp.]
MLQRLWIQFQRKRKIAGYTGILIGVLFAYTLLMHSIPDKMYVESGEQPEYSFGVPVTGTLVKSTEVFAGGQSEQNSAIHLTHGIQSGSSGQSGTYQVLCKLFGTIPLKRIAVQEVSKKELLPAGTNIGIYVKNDKIMIIGTGEVTDESGARSEPAKNVVQSGDYILAVNGEPVQSKAQLVKKISFCEGKKIKLRLLRDQKEEIEVSIKPVRSKEGIYQIGVWVRDDIAGVGTLTYVTDGQKYGALGHGVTDADVGSLIDMKKGSIYETTILEIRKGQRGQPGEMSGMINYDDEYKLGTVEENTNVGIYGTLAKLPDELKGVSALPVTYKEGIKKGKAQIISSVEGSRKAYDIQIEQTDYHSEGNNKGIQFQVTDKRLLEDTGGIIQGMSGSPIVQDGHIIGAVTHVFISDSTQGYGIFIENMLEH